jgi:hypothetical protein
MKAEGENYYSRPKTEKFTPAAESHGLWPWMAGACPLDKEHIMERYFLAGKLRRKA